MEKVNDKSEWKSEWKKLTSRVFFAILYLACLPGVEGVRGAPLGGASGFEEMMFDAVSALDFLKTPWL